MRLLIKGGRIIDPAGEHAEGHRVDILCDAGSIVRIEPELNDVAADAVVDAAGAWVLPGFIDLHAHVGEPGHERRERLDTLTQAAVRGGFTKVVVMPDTEPARDTADAVRALRSRGSELACCVLPVGALTRQRQGQEPTEWGELVEAGAIALGDGKPVADSGLVRRALIYLQRWGTPLFLDAMDLSLAGGASAWESVHATIYGLRCMPAEAEASALVREILLARLTGGRAHLQHVSTRQGVEWVRWAKEADIPVTAEVSWLHLVETDAVLGDYDTSYKVWPPLGTEADREALIEGLATGVIDAVVTDHTPFTTEEKLVEFDQAPFGAAGLETAVPALWTELVESGRMPAATLVERLTAGPARVLGLPEPRVAVGEPANLTILQPGRPWTLEQDQQASLAANHPYIGRPVRAAIVATVVDGTIRYEQER